VRAICFQSFFNAHGKISLASGHELWNNYVMRSTRNVVKREPNPELGHYSDPPLLVLASLSGGPKHGHAMVEDIARLCGTRLGPGTLYGAIARLEGLGWIEPLEPEDRRRPYRITGEGLRIFRAKMATLQQFVKAGTERLEPL
jgi:DNA-binding PadR family transcriptional regulator